jgi:hypothetical protein
MQKEKEQSLKLGGKELPTLNPEFDKSGNNKDFSRTTYYLLDKGSLPSGSGVGKSQQQLGEKSKKKILIQKTF